MSISVNGQSQVPPGFRFHPTEEELLQYYLKKKVGSEKIDLDVIQDVDLNKLEPWDIQGTFFVFLVVSIERNASLEQKIVYSDQSLNGCLSLSISFK